MSVLLEKRADGVAVVTLNRPKVLNALDVPAKEALADVWQEIADDRKVRVVILAGAGAKAFCAGSDIKEIDRTGRMVRTDTLLRAIPNVGIPLSKPVIAALHGFCIGMGMTLALHCDLRLAAKGTVLGYPEVRHGMISAVSALRLSQVIPSAAAMEMLLMARNISAEEALRFGLLNAVVDDVRAEAEKWAATIAGYSSSAVQATKRLATFSRRLSSAELAEIEGMRSFVESQDHYKEGAASFTKRTEDDKSSDKGGIKAEDSGAKAEDSGTKAEDISHGQERRSAPKRKADPTGA
jgi:enoyl-CoA hydratase/carnithine racemase